MSPNKKIGLAFNTYHPCLNTYRSIGVRLYIDFHPNYKLTIKLTLCTILLLYNLHDISNPTRRNQP